VHGGRVDEIVASQAGGVWYNHHYDARGHCIMLTSTSGNIVEQYDYDAFGFPYFYNAAGGKQGSQVYGNRFLFTGREWLSNLRIYDFRNRQYQPELGRFLQPDPKQFAAGDYNLYRYCHNDPINRTDPTGLEPEAAEKIKFLLFSRAVPLGSNIPRLVPTGSVSMTIKTFNALAKQTTRGALARTQSVFKDGTLSGVSVPRDVKVFQQGTWVTVKTVEDVDPGKGHGGVALLLHIHDRKGTVSPTMPGEDTDAMKAANAPMLFTSPKLYERNRAVIASPDGYQTVVDHVKDNP
jgi:RHS repeat-associated protein